MKAGTERLAQPAGLFTFSGLLPFFCKNFSRNGLVRPMMPCNGWIARLFAISGSQDPFNRFKAPPDLRDPEK
ncbi:hypothetical protein [Rhizobium rhizogenes]|uniref:hypothetical protein n=1 Tax=Rhizobium rhizogenes TaxID=359 RepID=UPI001667D14A|nr:hypothetical protein [Rhizobium rhizogenes]